MSAEIKNISSAEFIILTHKNLAMLEQTCRKFCKDGWYPVGDRAQKWPEWVQVMMRERIVRDKKVAPVFLDDPGDDIPVIPETRRRGRPAGKKEVEHDRSNQETSF